MTMKGIVDATRRVKNMETTQMSPAFFHLQSGYMNKGLSQNICMSQAKYQVSPIDIW